jgi:acetyl-CoA synthetase
MTDLLAIERYQDIGPAFSWDALWTLFDGDRSRMNIAHECIDRHRGKGVAARIQYADGHREEIGFDELADDTARFANWLQAQGVGVGERVAVMLEPSREFYVALFGAVKRGAIAVPLFTLFGPDALKLRLDDCTPVMVVAQGEKAAMVRETWPRARVVEPQALRAELAAHAATYEVRTAASDLAIYQYTSGTTRELPEAVRHTHRSVVTVMAAALYGVGLKPGDRYFCPSSPAWGHGLWHGTISALALGVAVGAYSGKFDAARVLEALEAFRIDTLAAAPTVFRLMRASGRRDRHAIALAKISYTGEPMDTATWDWIVEAFGRAPCSMYGSTEVGVLIANFPGYAGHEPRRGALGRPMPGMEIAVLDEARRPLPAGHSGEIAVRRKDGWFLVKDRGRIDEDGFFWIEGRSDDVIISAGWTMSAVEIESTLLRHPAVVEAAVVGVPDETRGLVAKAYIVPRDAAPALVEDIQRFMKANLSAHEYPRRVEFVAELPKTPAGKINRKVLRERG